MSSQLSAKARRIVLLIFFTSGALGLIYEVLWTRMLTTLYGNTTYAVSTILTAFMGGLAIGAALFGKRADRTMKPLRTYGLLEAGVGVCALLMPVALRALYPVYAWAFNTWENSTSLLTFLRFLTCAAVLAVPAILMGGTLPVLVRFAGRHENLGADLGRLYGANTFGAVAGCFLAGFVLIQTLGLTNLTIAAGASNLLIAAIAVFLSSRWEKAGERPAEAARTQPETAASRRTLAVIVAAFFLAGCASLCYEVIWTRILLFIFETTVHSFAIMLTTFLFGLALGGWTFGKVADRVPDPLRTFGWVELCVGLGALASIPLLGAMVSINQSVGVALELKIGWWGWSIGRYIEAAAVMLVPTFFAGAAFPLAAKAFARDPALLGARVGQIYSANTVGALLGSLLAGFVIIPLVGARIGITAAAAINLLVGAAIVAWRWQPRVTALKLAPAAAAVLAVVIVGAAVPKSIFYPAYAHGEHGAEIVFCKEGVTGTVVVYEWPQAKLIGVDGSDVAGTQFPLRVTQKLQGHIPLLVHGRAKDVMQIGFGSGETLNVLHKYPVRRIDGVEICPEIVPAARKYFSDVNGGVFDYSKRLRMIFMDGKNYALLTRRKYDVIMNDSVYPGLAGSSALYTRDHFLACKKRLNPGGVMSCWVPTDLNVQDFRMIVRTFQSVFPDTCVWLPNNCESKHALLVGCRDGLKIDVGRWMHLMSRPGVRDDLREIELSDPYRLLGCFLMNPDSARAYAKGAPVNTDAKPLLEYMAMRRDVGEAQAGEELAHFLRFRGSPAKYLQGFDPQHGPRLQQMTRILRSWSESGRFLQTLYWQVSERVVRKWIKAQPNNAAYHAALGDALLGMGRRSEAESAYRKALSLDAKLGVAHLGLGRLHMSERRYSQAAESLRRASDLMRDQAAPDLVLADAYLLLKRPQEAESAYRQALKKDPRNVAANLALALRYDARGDVEAAIARYEAVLSVGQNVLAANNLAYLYARQGKNLDRALELAGAAVKARPSPETLDTLALVLIRSGRAADALRLLTKALTLSPNNAALKARLAEAKRAQSQ